MREKHFDAIWFFISLGPGSALGEKGEKKSASEASREVVWGRERAERPPFPPPGATTMLASLADIFPIYPVFAFFTHCGAWSQASSLSNMFLSVPQFHREHLEENSLEMLLTRISCATSLVRGCAHQVMSSGWKTQREIKCKPRFSKQEILTKKKLT